MTYFDPLSLRIFIAICEERSFTEAADRESLTTSAISKRLTALEEQIGASLVARSRRGVHLTAAGEALLPAARALLQSMSRIQAHLSDYAGGVHGNVRVAGSMTPMASFLPLDVAAFMRRHDSVRVSLDERLSPNVVRAVEEGYADLGVYWDAIGSPARLETVPYRADSLVVLAHKDHPLARRKSVSFADTLQFERVTLKGGSIVQLTQHQLAVAEGEALKCHIQVRSFAAACSMVAANIAIAIVPREATLPFVKSFALKTIALSDDWALRRFVICMRDRSELTSPARLLLDELTSKWSGADAPGE